MERKAYAVELKALKDAPVYENHSRGKNWLAKIQKDPTAPSGLSRTFCEAAHGSYYYMIGDLQPLDVVEFGADYYNSKGSKRPNRWYGVVESVADDKVVFVHANSAAEAFSLVPVLSGVKQQAPEPSPEVTVSRKLAEAALNGILYAAEHTNESLKNFHRDDLLRQREALLDEVKLWLEFCDAVDANSEAAYSCRHLISRLDKI